MVEQHLIHATIVTLHGKGVLIRGASGSGKSDLALRLIDRGAVLIADDYCHIKAENGRIVATAPDSIAGQIEVRGLGIQTMNFEQQATIHLIVDLVSEYPRLPDLADQSIEIEGINVQRVALIPWEASAPLKVVLALGQSLSK
jgi:HPr kinase/phosphorylase